MPARRPRRHSCGSLLRRGFATVRCWRSTDSPSHPTSEYLRTCEPMMRERAVRTPTAMVATAKARRSLGTGNWRAPSLRAPRPGRSGFLGAPSSDAGKDAHGLVIDGCGQHRLQRRARHWGRGAPPTTRWPTIGRLRRWKTTAESWRQGINIVGSGPVAFAIFVAGDPRRGSSSFARAARAVVQVRTNGTIRLRQHLLSMALPHLCEAAHENEPRLAVPSCHGNC